MTTQVRGVTSLTSLDYRTATSTGATTPWHRHPLIPVPHALAAKFIVSEALPGNYLHSTWPSWTEEQRRIFLRDFADLFVGLANCGIPPYLKKRDMWHEISDTTHDSHSLLAKEIPDRSSDDSYIHE